VEQLLAADGVHGGFGRRHRDVSGRGKASGVGQAARGRAGGPGDAGRVARGQLAAGGNAGEGQRVAQAEKQRGRGERKTMGTCS
jgi:hypothetical protein